MVHIIKRNDDPPHTDDKMEALFDDIYEQLEALAPHMGPDNMERLAVWIADKVQAAYGDGYAQAAAEAREALEQGYLP